MEDRDKALEDLHNRISEIARKQKEFQEEIQKLHNDIFKYNLAELPAAKSPPIVIVEQPRPVVVEEKKQSIPVVVPPTPTRTSSPPPRAPSTVRPQKNALEEFIGTNLLNKIGVAILVIGIGYGTKYSIDHNLINPLTRIILGYLSGLALILIALKLKRKHENFSAVLLSGGMAVMYFITFAAYDIYQLIPQLLTFALMVAFTAFTVFAATQYNKEVIGIIGLTGAYAVPFLLSDGSGRVVILFSYITIINIGILTLSFKKDWRILYYIAFGLTWLSFAAWFGTSYNETKHLWPSLIFATLFFGTFYTMFLAYKLIKKEPLTVADLAVMLINSFVYYTYGYLSIDYAENGDQFLGVFTVFTALIHFVACAIIFKKQKQSKDLFYFLAGMVLVFLTIAVPVQLEGNYVTIVWAFEAALLFWIGRTKNFRTYERISYALIVLAFASLLQDWQINYPESYYYLNDTVTQNTIFINVQFLSSVLVVAALSIIYRLSINSKFTGPNVDSIQYKGLSLGVPALILFITYMGIFKEVEQLWNYKYAASKITIRGEYAYDQYDEDIARYKNLWLIYYSAIFGIVLSIIQTKIIKNKYLMIVNMSFNALTLIAFVVVGLYELSLLRSSYLNDQENLYYFRTFDNIVIRYVGLILITPLLFFNYRYVRDKFFPDDLRKVEHVLMHLAILVLLSSELIHWLDMARVENSYKLSLSILWGLYALFLIVLGLIRDQKHIRISAITLFGITLLKLFIYDMADMSTISKTIVMIILGALMLISSFLYNKFKRTAENEAN